MPRKHNTDESPPQPAAEAATQEAALEQSASSKAAGETSPPADPVAALRQEVEQLRAEVESQRGRAEENLRGWQRAQADFSNFRRRQEQERAEQEKGAEARLIFEILPVLDDLDRAWQTLPANLLEITWIGGVNLIDRKLRAVLSARGLTPVEALGEEFNPYSHEAVMREDGEPSELTTVVAEFQKGYKLRDRVIRPSLVKVGKAPGPAEEDTEPSPGA